MFETQTQKRETEVKQVLEKIPSNLISLNPTDILRVRRTPASIAREGTGSDNEEEMKVTRLHKHWYHEFTYLRRKR